MQTAAVVMGFVRYRGKILVLQRSHARSFYPGKWQMVTGHLDQKESAEEAVLREVNEETGLTGKITYSGKAFEYYDGSARWVIIPYIVDVMSDQVQYSPEHISYRWIEPAEYTQLDCLPGMKEDLESVHLL